MKNINIKMRYQVLNFDSSGNVSKYPIEHGVNKTNNNLFLSSFFDRIANSLMINKVSVPPIKAIQKELMNI